MHVRWDIVSLVVGTPPGPLKPGGSASASAPNGGDTITLTGSGTFVDPAGNNGSSNAVTGGGTWRTSTGQCVGTGSRRGRQPHELPPVK
jgi:hypothetical protein